MYKRNRRIRWNSAWTGGGNLGTSRGNWVEQELKHLGLAFGGYSSGQQNMQTLKNTMEQVGQLVEIYQTARSILAGCGTQTVALAFGGSTTVNVANTEEYNGTAWTAGGNLGTAIK
jgi:hypothetical protein